MKTEYKTVTIRASGGTMKFSEAKFDESCTEQINKVATKLGVDGWELLNVFSVRLEGTYSLVFKRSVK